jgi:hypothetical protein
MTFLGRILRTWTGEELGTYGPFRASFVPRVQVSCQASDDRTT